MPVSRGSWALTVVLLLYTFFVAVLCSYGDTSCVPVCVLLDVIGAVVFLVNDYAC